MAIDYWQKFEQGQIYHIYDRSIPDIDIFCDEFDCINFLSKFNLYCGPYFDTYAYCLIPNHFHFLCKIKALDDVRKSIAAENSKAATRVLETEVPINGFLVDQMRRFLSSISLKHKYRYDRRGPLLPDRFKRVKIKTESRLRYMLCYIHHNPIHHYLTKDYEEWTYSSYNTYFTNDKTNIKRKEILDWLGGIDKFKKIHQDFKLDPTEDHNIDQ